MRTAFTFFGPNGVPTPDELAGPLQAVRHVARISRSSEPQSGITDVPVWGAILEIMADDDELSDFGVAFPQAEAPLVQFVANAHIVIDGPERGVRFIGLPRRRSGLSPKMFKEHYGGVHAGLVLMNEGFNRHANRYVQHHVDCDTVRAIGDILPYDGVSEFWFDDVNAARIALKGASYMDDADLRSDEIELLMSGPSHRLFLEPARVLGDRA